LARDVERQCAYAFDPAQVEHLRAAASAAVAALRAALTHVPRR
jgi:hypothetical protein